MQEVHFKIYHGFTTANNPVIYAQILRKSQVTYISFFFLTRFYYKGAMLLVNKRNYTRMVFVLIPKSKVHPIWYRNSFWNNLPTALLESQYWQLHVKYIHTLLSLISRIHSFTKLFNFPKIRILLIKQQDNRLQT